MDGSSLRALTTSENEEILAQVLESSAYVSAVNYPGISSLSQREVALKQPRDSLSGEMISFRIKGGKEEAVKFCNSTKYFALAESLGGVESLCEVSASMTHAGMSKEVREAAEIFDDLIRLSVGIEDARDVQKDLIQAWILQRESALTRMYGSVARAVH